MTLVAGGILLRGSTPERPGRPDGDLDDRRRAARGVRRDALRKRADCPDDDGYDEARRDPQRPDRPAARADRALPRARPTSRTRSRFARVERARDLASAAAATTSPAARSPTAALMIDLSPMKGDPRRPGRAHGCAPRAASPGASSTARPHAHGLAVTGGAISTTGIAGYTLGGGLGWLMAKHGLGGRQPARASSSSRPTARSLERRPTTRIPDLFWALRGGGGNFGVAASFEYRLHPLEMVTGGLIAHPIDAGRRHAALLPRRGRAAARTT